MKKIIKVLVVAILTFLLISCDNVSVDNTLMEEVLDRVESSLQESLDKNQNLASKIDTYTISYQSSNTNVITNEGKIVPQEKDISCSLTIVIANNGKEYTRTIEVTVKGTKTSSLENAIINGLREFEDIFNSFESENYSPENYLELIEIFEAGKKVISNATDAAYIPLIIEEYIMYLNEIETTTNGIQKMLLEIENELYDILIIAEETISTDIILRNNSLYNSKIIWKSSNETAISSTGEVGDNIALTKVILSYDVIIDDVTYEGSSFSIYVKTIFELNSYYDDIDMSLRGDELKLALRELITISHRTIITYNDLRYKLPITDGDGNGNIILLYSRKSVSSKWDQGHTWNREHVWPQSLGWFNEEGAGADIHHIRPTSNSANSSRGNKPYGEVENREYYKKLLSDNTLYGYANSKIFEPIDEIKGDVARIIFYLLVRYPEADKYNVTAVASSMEMLLKWNAQDPVDDYERQRNEKAFELQGNCNPFIDNSEFAEMIFGKENVQTTRYVLGFAMTPVEVALY